MQPVRSFSSLPLHLLVFLSTFSSTVSAFYLNVTVRAFLSDDTEIPLSPTFDLSTPPAYSAPATYYLVGTGPLQILVWQPYSQNGSGGSRAVLGSCARTVAQTRNTTTNEDTLTFRIENVGWGRIVSDPIRSTLNGSAALPAPDLMVLGTTQVSTRVAAGEVMPLTRYLSEYAIQTGRSLSDEFPRSSLKRGLPFR
ncbi:hypothetical protein HDV00_012112 [Rhizophlyctis rosea]|nr:hypothetical protein HDV00_012112 [Rhizophlyctis rosea]